MCGFAGIFAYSNNAPPVQDAELLRIRDQMTLLGQEGEGLRFFSGRQIDYRRLSIIDLSEIYIRKLILEVIVSAIDEIVIKMIRGQNER